MASAARCWLKKLVLLAATLVAGLVADCGDPPTALRVRIDASPDIAASLAILELDVSNAAGAALYTNRWNAPIEFPADLTFTPGADREVTFEALALDASGATLASDSEQAGFVDQEVRWVELTLGECVGCPDGDSDVDSDSDTDSDTDSDSDSDSDSDTDSDADFDTTTMYVNPGCDPVVQSVGIDAAWTQGTGTNELVMITQGTRRWAFRAATNTWVDSLATRNLAQRWVDETEPDDALNPGTDPVVQAEGITAAFAMSKNATDQMLVVVVGTRHFTHDLALGVWVGDNGQTGVLADVFSTQGTVGGSSCPGGDPTTNPGADPGIQAAGISAISNYRTGDSFRVAGANQLWYGAYDATSFEFTFGCHFESQNTGFVQAGPPTCASGNINPGCDSVVGSDGIDAAWWTNDGVYHVTQGVRHWGFHTESDLQWLAEQYITNLADYWRANSEPDCAVTVPE